MKKVGIIILVVIVIIGALLAVPQLYRYYWLSQHGSDSLYVSSVDLGSANMKWGGGLAIALEVRLVMQLENTSSYEIEVERIDYHLWIGEQPIQSGSMYDIYLQSRSTTPIPIAVELDAPRVMSLAFRSIGGSMEIRITGTMLIPIRILGVKIASVRIPLDFVEPAGGNRAESIIDPYVRVERVSVSGPIVHLKATDSSAVIKQVEAADNTFFSITMLEWGKVGIIGSGQVRSCGSNYTIEPDKILVVGHADLEDGKLLVISPVGQGLEVTPFPWPSEKSLTLKP